MLEIIRGAALRGLFEPAYFTLPAVHSAMLNFLQDIIINIADFLTVTMLAFFHHPAQAKEKMFLPWFTWRLPIDEKLLERFEKHFRDKQTAFNMVQIKLGETLAGIFLQKLSMTLETSPYEAITELEGFLTPAGTRNLSMK